MARKRPYAKISLSQAANYQNLRITCKKYNMHLRRSLGAGVALYSGKVTSPLQELEGGPVGGQTF